MHGWGRIVAVNVVVKHELAEPKRKHEDRPGPYPPSPSSLFLFPTCSRSHSLCRRISLVNEADCNEGRLSKRAKADPRSLSSAPDSKTEAKSTVLETGGAEGALRLPSVSVPILTD